MPDVVQLCEWFAMCANPADGMMPHPILGGVPCCERCAAVVGAESELVKGTFE